MRLPGWQWKQCGRLSSNNFGVDADTARLLVGVLGNVRISQIVNPLKTVRVDMPLVQCEDRWVIHRNKMNNFPENRN